MKKKKNLKKKGKIKIGKNIYLFFFSFKKTNQLFFHFLLSYSTDFFKNTNLFYTIISFWWNSVSMVRFVSTDLITIAIGSDTPHLRSMRNRRRIKFNGLAEIRTHVSQVIKQSNITVSGVKRRGGISLTPPTVRQEDNQVIFFLQCFFDIGDKLIKRILASKYSFDYFIECLGL